MFSTSRFSIAMVSFVFFSGLAALSSWACQNQVHADDETNAKGVNDESCSEGAAATPATDERDSMKAPPPDDEQEQRTDERSSQTTAERHVREAIDAHGGLESFRSATPLQFGFDYEPERDISEDTLQIVDHSSWLERTRQWPADDPSRRVGRDEHYFWRTDGTSFSMESQFHILTPYYFTAIPFLLADDRVDIEDHETAEINGESYDVVVANFHPATGDAPIYTFGVHIHEEHRRVDAVRYRIGVSDTDLFRTYEDRVTIDGLDFATSHRIIEDEDAFVEGDWSDPKATIEISEIELRPDVPDDIFERPPGSTKVPPFYTF